MGHMIWCMLYGIIFICCDEHFERSQPEPFALNQVVHAHLVHQSDPIEHLP